MPRTKCWPRGQLVLDDLTSLDLRSSASDVGPPLTSFSAVYSETIWIWISFNFQSSRCDWYIFAIYVDLGVRAFLHFCLKTWLYCTFVQYLGVGSL